MNPVEISESLELQIAVANACLEIKSFLRAYYAKSEDMYFVDRVVTTPSFTYLLLQRRDNQITNAIAQIPLDAAQIADDDAFCSTLAVSIASADAAAIYDPCSRKILVISAEVPFLNLITEIPALLAERLSIKSNFDEVHLMLSPYPNVNGDTERISNNRIYKICSK